MWCVIYSEFSIFQIVYYCYAECLYAECRFAECLYAECRFAECLYAECRFAVFMLSVVLLNVIMLSVVLLNVIMLSVILLNVFMLTVVLLNVYMLSVVLLNVIMLSVVAPLSSLQVVISLETFSTLSPYKSFYLMDEDKLSINALPCDYVLSYLQLTDHGTFQRVCFR